MQDVRADRQICVLDHAVGLCNTGQSTERKQYQNRCIKIVTTAVNTACDFKQTIIEVEESFIQVMKRHKGNIQQVEKDHISA